MNEDLYLYLVDFLCRLFSVLWTVESIFYVLYSTLLSAHAVIEPRTLAVYALTVRAATTKLHLIHTMVLVMIAGYSINFSF
jgi:hypothetical protein